MTVIKDITNYIEKLAPLRYAEDFDNVGLLVGSYETPITGVLVTLDCLENVVDEAIDKSCNLIVAFHPIIFKGIKNLRPDDYVKRVIIKAIKNDIAIYATHTALDVAHGGVSYRMAQELGLQNLKTLAPKNNLIKKLTTYIPIEHFDQVQNTLFQSGAGHIGNYNECGFSVDGDGTFKGNELSNPQYGVSGIRSTEKEKQLHITYLPHLESKILKTLKESHPYEEVAYEIVTLENSYQKIGMGCVGEFPEELEIEDFISTLKSTFNHNAIRTSLSRKRTIKKVAVLGGSGAFAIQNAKSYGADAYVTADLKYHDFFQGQDILLCDIGHYESEQFTKNLLTEYLTEKFTNFAILCAQAQTNPVNYY